MLGSPDDADLAGRVELAVRSGFPEPALRLDGLARQAWLDSYVDQLMTRDVPAIGGSRPRLPAPLPRGAVLRDGNVPSRLVGNFVAAQIRAELPLATSRPRWYHLRDKKRRHEIDLAIEFGDGRVASIEIKAPAAPTRSDARHLEWLRDELGKRFIATVVLHTGPRVFELADRINAAPISTIWA